MSNWRKEFDKELREELSAIEHERWANWQRYCHDKGKQNQDMTITLPAESVKHWERQINTSYSKLTEKEKDSDREQVDRYIGIIKDFISEVEADAYERGKVDIIADEIEEISQEKEVKKYGQSK